MARTYAIPDLHGRFDLMRMAVAEITKRGGGTVVFLGDYIDRGPQSREIVEALMAGPPEGQRWIMLKGNHEDMMVASHDDPMDTEMWVVNGGAATLRSYGATVPADHIEWCRRLPLYHEDEHRIFVHAGADPTKVMAEQTEAFLCWFRCERDLDYGRGGKHIVHGHTPFRDGPVLLKGRTNLDTYAVGTGWLCVGVFDDEAPGGPTEVF